MLRVLIIVFALGAGCLASWLALSARPGGDSAGAEAAAPPVPTTEVLVASSDIPQGQAVSDATVRWQPWPRDALNPGFITRADKPDAVKSLSGAVARVNLAAGDPIREERLAMGSTGFMAAILAPGKRAVAIRISVESTAGGFILPNDRVDVIHTIARPKEGQTDNLSRTILTNIRVLAIDQKVEQKGAPGEGGGESKGDEAVAMGKTATLELSPDQAEAIAAGQASGILSLSLRPVTDSNEQSALVRPNSGFVRILRAGQSEQVRF